MVFSRLRIVIFVDGCFWHGCRRCHDFERDCNVYWLSKILANKARDLRVRARLRRQGWRVIRVWEHDLRRKDRFVRVVERVRAALMMIE